LTPKETGVCVGSGCAAKTPQLQELTGEFEQPGNPQPVDQEDGACRLSETGRRRTLEMWTTKVEQDNRDNTSMRTLMRDEALAIERHVLGMGEYKPFARLV
jgi:CRISPR/Cas system-associated endonuclease Cas1